MNFNERQFMGVDLNALVTFLTVYRERSVGDAAKRLEVTQPAVSNTLKKLRTRFAGPLLV